MSTTKNTRADAQRTRTLIIEAAISSLGTDPSASVADITKAAGVGRVTFYGHFGSRDDLIAAVSAQVMLEVEQELGAVSTEGTPLDVLGLIAQSSWKLIDRFQGVVAAVARGTDDSGPRTHHEHVLGVVRYLIERGQASGEIRSDQSSAWLASCLYSVLHNAAAETRGGRLTDAEVTASLPSTVQAIMTGPK
jgi:TetR/AcrR family transcriptional repressor of mexCD-oprJ operon